MHAVLEEEARAAWFPEATAAPINTISSAYKMKNKRGSINLTTTIPDSLLEAILDCASVKELE